MGTRRRRALPLHTRLLAAEKTARESNPGISSWDLVGVSAGPDGSVLVSFTPPPAQLVKTVVGSAGVHALTTVAVPR